MVAATVWPGALLLIIPFDPALFKNNCLSSNYYGNFRQGNTLRSVFRPDSECLDSQTFGAFASVVESTRQIEQLVWLEEQNIDNSLKSQALSFRNGLDAFLDTLSQHPSFPPSQHLGQEPLNDIRYDLLGYEVLYRSPKAALLSVSHGKGKVIDTLLPRFWKSTLLPASPIPFRPVSTTDTKHVKDVLSDLRFDPVIASIVGNMSLAQMRNDIRFLSGEDQKSGIISRHSFSSGALNAASWLKARFEDTGASCELKPFLPGFSPNVVCRYPSLVNTTATVILGAHYDSRGSFGNTHAPGANDDGSGTVSLLCIARTISRKVIKFHSNVELVAFSGEEQGLLGSKAYASELRAKNANITAMIQADMLAYHDPGEPPQLGLSELIGSPTVTQLVSNVSAIYSPELRVGFTTVCCSDHQSFHELGFPASQVFERAGPIADPMYHNSGDLSERVGYDFDQLKSIAKVQFATLLHIAGYEL